VSCVFACNCVQYSIVSLTPKKRVETNSCDFVLAVRLLYRQYDATHLCFDYSVRRAGAGPIPYLSRLTSVSARAAVDLVTPIPFFSYKQSTAHSGNHCATDAAAYNWSHPVACISLPKSAAAAAWPSVATSSPIIS